MMSLTTFDALKSSALVCTFLGYLAMCAALVQWHDKTWKIAIEPTKVLRRTNAELAPDLAPKEESQAMSTAHAAAPLTYEAFRQRQKAAQLDGLSYKSVRVAWTDLGEGKPVILLHGIPTWSFLYNEVIALLAQHNRVIAPDFLGHGYSDRRDFFDRSLLAQTDMIILLMNHLGIPRASFVGHDTGGGVALIMAIHHPERVARLVLTNVVAYDSWPIDDMIALGNPNWRSKSPKEVADFLASGLPDGLFNKERLTPEFKTGIVAPYSDEEGKISIIRNASALNTNHTTMLVERHGEIRLPTLCLWGVHDPWQTIHDGERLSREIPNARLVRVEDASHWIPHDTPARFAEEVRNFLANG